jgi:hypothetical protein
MQTQVTVAPALVSPTSAARSTYLPLGVQTQVTAAPALTSPTSAARSASASSWTQFRTPDRLQAQSSPMPAHLGKLIL